MDFTACYINPTGGGDWVSFSRETSKKDQQDQQDLNDGGQEHFHSSHRLEPLQPYLLLTLPPGICQLFYIFSFNMVCWHLFVIYLLFMKDH